MGLTCLTFFFSCLASFNPVSGGGQSQCGLPVVVIDTACVSHVLLPVAKVESTSSVKCMKPSKEFTQVYSGSTALILV